MLIVDSANFNENSSNLTNMKIMTGNTEHHCLLTFRANCRTTFPPVPKRYRNSKVQPLSFNTIIFIAKSCEKLSKHLVFGFKCSVRFLNVGQLNQLNDDLGKLQKELQSCQGNIKTLNDKLTFDM